MSAGDERIPDRVHFAAALTGSLPRRKGETLEESLERAERLLRNAFAHWLKSLQLEQLVVEPDEIAQLTFDVYRAVHSLPTASRRILLELWRARWLEQPAGGVAQNGRRVALAALQRRGYVDVEDRGRHNLDGDYVPRWGHTITEEGIRAASVLIRETGSESAGS